MNEHFLKYPVGPVAIKMAVAIGIGMLVGMERKWSNKEAGIRTFAIVALLGMLSAMIGQDFIIVSMIGVFLLIVLMNGRSIWVEKSLEITTSAALIVNYILGVMVGLGHIFTPVAGAIVMTMLLAWKTELNRFAGGLQPAEIRSAILLGLIGFVIYPILPDRYIDPWDLFNPSDAWLSVIAISGIGFVNYVLLRMFSTRGFYLSAIFGGLVNSTATAAEIAGRVQAAGLASRITTLVLLTNIAMFARNLLLVVMFSPDSLASTILPLLGMSLVSALWIWRDNSRELGESNKTITLELDSPISIKKVLWFGLLFLLIAIGGTLLTKVFGSYGMLATGIFGGMVSSASTTAAAATMASHGKITASVAGSVAVLSSLASAVITLPVVWKSIDDKAVVKKLTIELITVLAVGIAIVLLDRIFQFSELLLQ
jgi:uncharacterized membrane protein (DUF4010 family)